MKLSQQQKFGLLGEQWALEHLFKNRDVFVPANFSYPYDFLIDGVLPVEIKIAREKQHKAHGKVWRVRYQFNIGDVFHSHGLTILLCLNGDIYPFIVPNWFIRVSTSVQITSHPSIYKGWLKPFLWNIAQIDKSLFICKKYDSRFLQLFEIGV